ncbi:MAG: type II secretion system protein [Nitrosomonadales bacterium]|nr:type II secretion system protein [Nitrosomonadales bacterium]
MGHNTRIGDFVWSPSTKQFATRLAFARNNSGPGQASPFMQLRIRPGSRLPPVRYMGGAIFMGMLAVVAIMSIGLFAVGDIWSTTRQREKEQELLFIGHQFRSAIEAYSQNDPRGKQVQTYPMYLEDMLVDPRYPNAHRYLRKIYIDPMTGKNEWGLLKNSNGGIYGVYSLSEDVPIKSDNFDMADAGFSGAKQYSSWTFTYSPSVPDGTVRP